MRVNTQAFTHQSKNILRDGLHFISLPVKVSTADFEADANGRKIVKAGTIISAAGKEVNDATAFGVVYEDIDITGATQLYTVPVIVHGVVELDKLPVQPAQLAKDALKQILFV